MHAWHGHDPRRVPPLILGHEACGTVLEGGGVTGPKTGERVVLNPLISCGTCGLCREGRANLCASRKLIGMVRPGAFAEQIAIPLVNLVSVPEKLDPAKAALTEPCATAWHALVLAARASWRPLPECRALVIGGGSVGLLGGLILKAWGAREVQLAEINPLRRQTARDAGLKAFHPIGGSSGEEMEGYDLVLDAVGSTTTRAAAIAAVQPGRCHRPCRTTERCRRIRRPDRHPVGNHFHRHLHLYRQRSARFPCRAARRPLGSFRLG